jgi:hypothetical protein
LLNGAQRLWQGLREADNLTVGVLLELSWMVGGSGVLHGGDKFSHGTANIAKSLCLCQGVRCAGAASLLSIYDGG